MSRATATVRAGNRRLGVSHPGKPMFGRSARRVVTKREVVEHYALVGAAIARLIRDHPLVMQAFPGGLDGPGFYMKNAQAHFPDWIRTARMRKRGGHVEHVLGNDTATLAYLANQNTIEFHAWPSRRDKPTQPDRVIFDLDPPGTKFADVRAAARDLGALLRERGMQPFTMTTGSRGLHLTVPIRRGPDFREVHRWAKALATDLVEASPRKLTIEFLKANRGGRIFVDVNRNAYAQHAVAPYSLRAREGAPVAMPLRWDELEDRRLRPNGFRIGRSVAERLDGDDPWAGFGRAARALR